MPPKKSDAAKSSSSVPPLEPHDPSAEPEVSAGAREVEEREFAIGRLKTQLGTSFRMRAPCSRSRLRRFATRWCLEEADAGDVRAHLRRELITAEALVNTLAASVAERESEVKAQADAFESAWSGRARGAPSPTRRVSALKRHDLEAEKHRKREMDRTNLLAAIDCVSETLAFESREERLMALLEGEASTSSTTSLAERSHELIIRETKAFDSSNGPTARW